MKINIVRKYYVKMMTDDQFVLNVLIPKLTMVHACVQTLCNINYPFRNYAFINLQIFEEQLNKYRNMIWKMSNIIKRINSEDELIQILQIETLSNYSINNSLERTENYSQEQIKLYLMNSELEVLVNAMIKISINHHKSSLGINYDLKGKIESLLEKMKSFENNPKLFYDYERQRTLFLFFVTCLPNSSPDLTLFMEKYNKLKHCEFSDFLLFHKITENRSNIYELMNNLLTNSASERVINSPEQSKINDDTS